MEPACAQTEYPAGLHQGTEATFASPVAGHVIRMLRFCVDRTSWRQLLSRRRFKKDPNNHWGYIPAAAASACLGASSCTFKHGDGTIKGVSVTYGSGADLAQV